MALTIWQPWATLIMGGFKPYEFRRWPAPAKYVGERIVIHAGVRPIKGAEIVDLIQRINMEEMHAGLQRPREATEMLAGVLDGDIRLPIASALGTAVLGQPRKAVDIFEGKVTDSSRIDEHVWGWPMGEPQPFEPPVPCRGFQGFWPYQGQTA